MLPVQVRTEDMVVYSTLWGSGLGQQCGGQGFSSGLRDGPARFSQQKPSLSPSLGRNGCLLLLTARGFSAIAHAGSTDDFKQKSSWLHF